MTKEQLKRGKELTAEIEKLQELRNDIARSQTLTFGLGGRLSEGKAIVQGRYVADFVTDGGVSFRMDFQGDAAVPEWAATAHKVARLIVCDAMDAEIARLQKELDEL